MTTRKRWKQKWTAIWNILRMDYFVLFTFNNKFGAQVTTGIDLGTEVHPLVGDALLAIQKAEYYKDEA